MSKIKIAIKLLKLGCVLAKFIKSQKEAEREIVGESKGVEKLGYVLEKAEEFLTDNEKELVSSIGFRELSELAFRAITSWEV